MLVGCAAAEIGLAHCIAQVLTDWTHTVHCMQQRQPQFYHHTNALLFGGKALPKVGFRNTLCWVSTSGKLLSEHPPKM